MKSEHIWRYTLLGTLLTVFAGAIFVRLVSIQLNPEQIDAFLRQREMYAWIPHTIQPARGLIYDRWGNVLAGNSTVYEVGIELEQVVNPHTIALASSVVMGLDYNEVYQVASQPPSPTAIYRVVADLVTVDKVDRLTDYAKELEELNGSSRDPERSSLRGLVFRPHLQRSYPEKELASNILGFVGRNDQGELTGYFGLEANFDELLAGAPQQVMVPNDPIRAEQRPNVPPGSSLVLTIDRTIQAEMESLVDRAVETYGADSGTIIIMDPESGDVLAMATTPRLDLNQYWRYGDIFPGSTPFNRAISQAYEPGSVFKVLTMAAAIDSGAVKLDTIFLDTGIFEIGGIYIYNWNRGVWGEQDMQGCMQHSLNVCLAWVASQMGNSTFYRYMDAFGLGHLTGIELYGESSGRLKAPGDADWVDADLGTNAFGQGVAATPLQMIAAVSSLANDGKMMAPRIVRAIVDKGRQFETEQRTVGLPVRPETAKTMTEMLARSLEEEASVALVEGYRVAGKTGTGEIPTPFGYTSNVTNASFVGWGPTDDPKFVVYVWLEKPSASIWGSETAAPVFAQVVERLVVLMDIPPDGVRPVIAGQ